MLVKTLGTVLIIVGLASILFLALPSLASISYRISGVANPRAILVSDKGLYLVFYEPCIQMPRAEVYQGYLKTRLTSPPFGLPEVRLLDRDSVRVSLYIAVSSTGACGVAGAPLPEVRRVSSWVEVDRIVRSLFSSAGYRVVSLHDLRLGERVGPLNVGGVAVDVAAVVYLPASSFAIAVSPQKIVSGGTVLRDLEANINTPWNSTYYRVILERVLLEVTRELAPEVTPLVAARAASLIAGGVLVLAVDAGLHPEYYTGVWSVFRRLATALGLARGGRR